MYPGPSGVPPCYHLRRTKRPPPPGRGQLGIPHFMLFRTGRYFRTRSTIFAPVQLPCFLSELDFFSLRKWKKIIGTLHRCFNLRILISNANSAGVRVWWRRIYAHMQQNPKESPDMSSANTHPSRIRATHHIHHMTSFISWKMYEFGQKTRKLYWGEYGTSSAKIPSSAKSHEIGDIWIFHQLSFYEQRS